MTAAVEVGGTARTRRAEPAPTWVLHGPWERSQTRVPAVLIVAGAVGLAWTWYGVSGTLAWTDQTVWVTLGVLSLLLALVGVATWIRIGMRNVRGLQRLLLGAARAELAAPDLGAQARVTDISSARHVVVMVGGSIYHRPDCLLVAGKPVTERGRDEAARSGLTACGMCAS